MELSDTSTKRYYSPENAACDFVYVCCSQLQVELAKAKDEVRSTGTISVATSGRINTLMNCCPRQLEFRPVTTDQLSIITDERFVLTIEWQLFCDTHMPIANVLTKREKQKILMSLDRLIKTCDIAVNRVQAQKERCFYMFLEKGSLPPDGDLDKSQIQLCNSAETGQTATKPYQPPGPKTLQRSLCRKEPEIPKRSQQLVTLTTV